MRPFRRGPGPRDRARRAARGALFAVWFAGITIPLATLAAQHDLPMAIHVPASSLVDDAAGRVTVRHVLAADCECSQAVAQSLLARRADAAEREQVWIIGEAAALRRDLEAAGYAVVESSPERAAETLGVVGAPVLLVYSRTEPSALYAGGYAPRRPRVAAQVDVDTLVRAVRTGGMRNPYPAYGCIVGDNLRRQVDPFGLKYTKKTS